MTEYLQLDDILAVAATFGRSAEIRDIGLLQSAVIRPSVSVFGEDAYPNLDDKAAALLHAIVAGHPLVDGNKRLGWVAVRLFYRRNERDLRMPADDAFTLVIEIAEGRLTDVPEIARRLANWVVDLDDATWSPG